MSIATTVNRNRNGLLLAYIANGIPGLHLRKMLKIIYLIDEHFMKMRGFPLTWFEYYAWSKGPVAPEVYAIKKGAFGEYVSYHLSDREKRIENLVPDVSQRIKAAFSESEATEIDRLIGVYGAYTADELSDITHQSGSAWSKVVAANNLTFGEDVKTSGCRIAYEDMVERGDWRLDAYADARWAMELESQLESTRTPSHKIKLQVVTPSEREQWGIPVYTPAIP